MKKHSHDRKEMDNRKEKRMKKTDFSGFDDWVEIFAGGPQKDMTGKTQDGDALIEKAVATFNPAYHEPPMVLGHPSHDAPAFGWVSDLKAEIRNGVKRLYAKFKQVAPEFEDLVKSGRIKKRSAAFYQDGRLRHVGWLGAMPPAVKGLADVLFSEDEKSVDFEFMEYETRPANEKKTMKFHKLFKAFRFWKQSEEEPGAALNDSISDGKGKPAAKFTESDLAAAWEEAFNFAYEEAKKNALAELAEAKARRKKDGNAGAMLEMLIAAKMKEDKDLTYSAAFIEVQKARPDLAVEYLQELNI
jgi:hypothetical protein